MIGLTDSEEVSYSLDAALTPRDRLTLYSFVSLTEIDSTMIGSELFGEPDWRARQRDSIRGAGAGLEWQKLLSQDFDAGLDYSYSDGRGDIRVHTASAAPGFPDLKNRMHGVRLYGRYRVSEQLSLRLEYWYERYRSEDFFIDDVEVDTLSNLLTMGQESPDYAVNVLMGSVRYQFRR